MVELFFQYLKKKDWPPDDKGDDLRIRSTKVEDLEEEDVRSNPDEGGSRARKRRLNDPQPAPGTSKRSRV